MFPALEGADAGLAVYHEMGWPGQQRWHVAAAALLSIVSNSSSFCIRTNSKPTALILNNGNVPRTFCRNPRDQGRFSTEYARAERSTTCNRMTASVADTKQNPAARESTTSSNASPSLPASTAIVGGGPTGLAVALMLARRGYRNVCVYERLAEPPPPASPEWGNPERSYNLGIGGRGQTALAKLGAAEKVLSWCAEAVVSFFCFLLHSHTMILVCTWF